MRKSDLLCSLQGIVQKTGIHQNEFSSCVCDLECDFLDSVSWITTAEYSTTARDS